MEKSMATYEIVQEHRTLLLVDLPACPQHTRSYCEQRSTTSLGIGQCPLSNNEKQVKTMRTWEEDMHHTHTKAHPEIG